MYCQKREKHLSCSHALLQKLKRRSNLRHVDQINHVDESCDEELYLPFPVTESSFQLAARSLVVLPPACAQTQQNIVILSVIPVFLLMTISFPAVKFWSWIHQECLRQFLTSSICKYSLIIYHSFCKYSFCILTCNVSTLLRGSNATNNVSDSVSVSC